MNLPVALNTQNSLPKIIPEVNERNSISGKNVVHR